MRITLYSLLCTALLVAAAPVPEDEPRSITWPKSVDINTTKPFRRAQDAGLTNQERMSRGMGPAKPKSLMKHSKDLVKRLDPHPSTGVIGTQANQKTYTFDSCYDLKYYTRHTLTSTDVNDAVAECAQYVNDESKSVFAVVYFADNSVFTCVDNLFFNYATQQDCNASNFARYILA